MSEATSILESIRQGDPKSSDELLALDEALDRLATVDTPRRGDGEALFLGNCSGGSGQAGWGSGDGGFDGGDQIQTELADGGDGAAQITKALRSVFAAKTT